MLIAAVLVVLGIVALTGGFAEAAAGRRTALPDESVTTARWTFEVHRAELTDRTPDGYETDPVVRIQLSVTNTSQRSLFAPQRGVLVLTLPDGTRIDDLSVRSAERSGRFDPDVPVDGFVEVDPPATWPPDAIVLVTIHDEEPSGSFISDDDFSIATDATTVRVPCPDNRAPR